MNVYKKEGKIYLFNSKYENFNFPYTITPEIKKIVNQRLEESINYLKNSFIEIDGIKEVSLFDVSMGANIQPKKYHAELYNRIKTMRDIARKKGFDTPVFMTLTPPSYLKPLKQIKLKSKNTYKLVDNPKFCGSANFIKESRDYLSDVWRKFLQQQIFKDIKKEFNERMIYLRTYEPFLDGSCHAHIVLFIPNSYKERFLKIAKKYFKTKTDIKTEFNGDIGGVVAYLLKYVLKTFKNGISGELSDITYWYIYYEIRRFSTSRTVIPMYLYRKIKGREFFQDLQEMTNLYDDGYISCDLIADPFKMANCEKMLWNDYKIDAIVVSVNGFYETIHYVAYKRNENVKVIFPDKKVGINGEQAKIKSLIPIIKSSIRTDEESKSNFISSWTQKSYDKMTDLELFEYYTQVYHGDKSVIQLAILENYLLYRGFGRLVGIDERHNIIDENMENLKEYFQQEKMLMELDF